MTDLSPAAQAVLNAAINVAESPDAEAITAAALRAAADQHTAIEIPFSVVDEWEKVKGSCASFYAAAEWGYYQALKELHTIADELDGI